MSRNLESRICKLEDACPSGEVYMLRARIWCSVQYWSFYPSELGPNQRKANLIGPFTSVKSAVEWALEDMRKTDPQAVRQLLANRDLESVLNDKWLCISLAPYAYPPQLKKGSASPEVNI